jgi:hypothetical protein
LAKWKQFGKRRNKEEEKKKERKNERKGLTLTGLLMEGSYAQLRWLAVVKAQCYTSAA